MRFYNRCVEAKILGEKPICIETLRRLLKSEGLYKTRPPHQPRKRYEMRYFGELWVADFMHGPKLHAQEGDKRKKRAILMAIIDDHSRVITGFAWGLAEDTKLIEAVFKDAILTYGIPDRFYCDNGPAFSSQYLALVCASLNVGLIHSKPYDSPSRGKVERFFRSVRQGFLCDVGEESGLTLQALNENFRDWLRDYHHRHHHGIDGRPLDRLQASSSQYPRKRIDSDSLEEFFMVTVKRLVNKDSTLSLNNVIYEVPPEFIDQRVELKFKQERPTEVFLYHDGRRVTKVTPVDSQLNGMVYKPSPRISDLALHELIQGGKT